MIEVYEYCSVKASKRILATEGEPAGPQGAEKYPFNVLCIGWSFVVFKDIECSQSDTLRDQCRKYGKRFNKRFSVVEFDDSYEIVRIK